MPATAKTTKKKTKTAPAKNATFKKGDEVFRLPEGPRMVVKSVTGVRAIKVVVDMRGQEMTWAAGRLCLCSNGIEVTDSPHMYDFYKVKE